MISILIFVILFFGGMFEIFHHKNKKYDEKQNIQKDFNIKTYTHTDTHTYIYIRKKIGWGEMPTINICL